MNAYYCNTPCTIVTEIDEHEAVIELYSDEPDCDCAFDDCPSLYPTRAIVPRRHITETPITNETVLDIVRKAEIEAREKAREIVSDAKKEKLEIEKRVAEIRKRCEGFEGLNVMLDFLSGEIKFVVYVKDSYGCRCGIASLDELMCGCDSHELASVSFRSKGRQRIKKRSIQMYIGQYSDDSGSKYLVEGFRTFNEAKEHLFDLLRSGKMKMDASLLANFKKWNMSCEEATKYEHAQKVREQNDRTIEIQKLKDKIATLEREA